MKGARNMTEQPNDVVLSEKAEHIQRVLQPYFLANSDPKKAQRVRVFLADPKTGLGHVYEHSFTGYAGISDKGYLYVVRNGTSVDRMSFDEVGKITDEKKNVLYEVDNFHMDLSVRKDEAYQYPWAVYQGDVPKKRLKTEEEAILFKDYLEGKRNRPW